MIITKILSYLSFFFNLLLSLASYLLKHSLLRLQVSVLSVLNLSFLIFSRNPEIIDRYSLLHNDKID